MQVSAGNTMVVMKAMARMKEEEEKEEEKGGEEDVP